MDSIADTPAEARDLLERLEAKGALLDWKKLRALQCACCRLIWHRLPEPAQAGLELAEAYNAGEVTDERLSEMRVQLWRSPGVSRGGTPQSNAFRAVICCMYEDTEKWARDDHMLDTALYCMEFCNSVEPHQPEQYRLLVEIFGLP